MRPYLLISNDDGVEAPGINFLVETLRPYADILVMAPDSARSGFSCSITSTNPITYKVLRQEEGLTVCSCSGTPTDCVKMALNLFTDRKFDLVIGEASTTATTRPSMPTTLAQWELPSKVPYKATPL